MDFTGKVALITGGGGGSAALLGFASRGAEVVVVDFDQSAGEVSANLRQRGGQARLQRPTSRSRDAAELRLTPFAIDCFFNNAGSKARLRRRRNSTRTFSIGSSPSI